MMQTATRLLSKGWSFRELAPSARPIAKSADWLPAVVPGFVHLDLMRAGVIADPFDRMYERGVQWVDLTDWVYRCEFDVDGGELAAGRHVLRFGGLDTVAKIVLNGETVGEVNNMFVPHEFEVTSVLQAGTNTLEVEFTSAQRVGEARREAFLADPEMEPFQRGLMPRSMIRKAQYMFGWDWGPCLRSCGIWQDVELIHIPAARIGDWSWTANFDDAGHCNVVVRLRVEGVASHTEVQLTGHGADARAEAAVESGAAKVELAVPEPMRWWPAGHGDQPLYDLTVLVSNDGAIADRVEARVGLREVELVREPDDVGESFFFRVNGMPIFAKGANWIPDDSFPARTTPDRVRAQLQLARDCGMNMVRVWGGGLYESDEFYDACADLGLLVWQDFTYACALYPDDDAAADVAMAEARSAIRRLRNHTALALYCGNNENQWLAGLLFGEAPRVLGERLYDETLPAAVSAEDPSRPYWNSSPYGSGPDVNGEGDGDCHYWNVWHGAGDWRYYTDCTARFVSEFGFASPPALRTLEEALDSSDLGVDTPQMRWHDKTNKGYDTYLGYIALHYPASSTAADLVYYGQLNQAAAMRYGIEHFRRLRPHTMGTLVWQLNDCWPVQSWAWVDYRLRPKAAWYAARRFYAPLLLSVTSDEGRVRVHLVNDGPEPVTGEVVVRAVDSNGDAMWEVRSPAVATTGASTLAVEADLPDRVNSAAAQAVIHTTFAHLETTTLLVEPKDLKLSPATLTVTATDGPDCVVLRIESDRVALAAMLELDRADASWSDNFFDLYPGEPRPIEVRPSAAMTAAEVQNRLRWRVLND